MSSPSRPSRVPSPRTETFSRPCSTWLCCMNRMGKRPRLNSSGSGISSWIRTQDGRRKYVPGFYERTSRSNERNPQVSAWCRRGTFFRRLDAGVRPPSDRRGALGDISEKVSSTGDYLRHPDDLDVPWKVGSRPCVRSPTGRVSPVAAKQRTRHERLPRGNRFFSLRLSREDGHGSCFGLLPIAGSG